MNRAVIAIADQVIVQDLRTRLDQSDSEVEVVFVAESTQEMVAAVLTHRPSLVFVHDQLGPGSMAQAVRDLVLRNPAMSVLVVTSSVEASAFSAALDAGARGVLVHPFDLEDLNHRLAIVLEWGQTLRAAMSDRSGSTDLSENQGARVIAVAGAKGGVGATVIASHLAWDVARSESGMRVCLVDLDIGKGDVPSYLDVSHRVSVADLAKISEDLTARAVSDTVVVHSSGLHLLLAPTEIRDTEFVTPEAVRRIIGQLRSLYHLVLIDTGSAITTTQAAAVESADVTLQIVTADVPALRAARRQVVAWESLSVAGADAVNVVVNRFVRRSEIQQDTVDMLALGRRSEVLVPDLERGLERACNSRTPAEVRNGTWWKSLRAIGNELGVTRAFRGPTAEAKPPVAPPGETAAGTPTGSGGPPAPAPPLTPVPAPTGRRRSRVLSRGAGQATLETAVMVPFALILLALCFQVVLLGLAFVWSGTAATAAARAASLGENPQAAAEAAVPQAIRRDVRTSVSGTRVVVRVRPALLVGNGISRDLTVDVDHSVVREPR